MRLGDVDILRGNFCRKSIYIFLQRAKCAPLDFIGTIFSVQETKGCWQGQEWDFFFFADCWLDCICVQWVTAPFGNNCLQDYKTPNTWTHVKCGLEKLAKSIAFFGVFPERLLWNVSQVFLLKKCIFCKEIQTFFQEIKPR